MREEERYDGKFALKTTTDLPAEVELRKRLESLGPKVEWDDLILDLSQLRAIELKFDEERHLQGTDVRGVAYAALRTVGLRPPPLAQPLNGAPIESEA